MHRLRMVTAAMGMLLAGVVLAQTMFTATLSSSNEVPPNPSDGWGRGIFVLSADQDSLYYSIVWRTAAAYSASHIHAAPAGANGGVVHTLQNAGSAGSHGVWAIDTTNLTRLFNEGLYVNVHSVTWPGGEIRGQILNVPFADTTYAATISGLQEVPPVPSTGWGLGTLLLSPDQDSLYYALLWVTNGSYSASHIHVAPAGVNGGVAHTLQNANSTGSHGAWAIDAAHVSRLRNDSLYVNVHSTTWPGGEIRGQIYLLPPPAPCEVPEHDVCPGMEIATLPFEHPSSVACANADYPHSQNEGGPDVVYLVTAPCAATIRAEVCEADFGARIDVWSATDGACPPDELLTPLEREVCGSGEFIRFDAEAGQQFYLVVYGAPDDAGTFVLRVEAAPCTPQSLVVHVSGTDVHLNWAAGEGATGYRVYRADSEPVPTDDAHLLGATADPMFIDSGVLADPNTRRFYAVTAVSAAQR